MRAAICLTLIAFNALVIREYVLLLGSQSVRTLEWAGQGEFTLQLGAAIESHPACLAAGSFRLGELLYLRLRTPGGMRAVLIDGKNQQIRAFRGLCRALSRVSRRTKQAVPGACGSRADTIWPKV